MADAPIAGSSSAPGPAPSLESLTPTERTEWRMTGNLPDSPKETDSETSPADSSPAEPVEQVASTEASPSPAPEPGTPRKSNADTRIPELLKARAAERERAERAERRLAELEARSQTQPDAPAVPSPASGDAFPAFDAWAEKNPDGSYDQFMLEKFEHVQSRKQSERQQQQQAQRFIESAVERQTSFQHRYHEAVKSDPQLPQRINPILYDLKTVDACLQAGEPVTALNAVAQEIVESPVAARLLVHLSEHPDEMEALSRMNPAAVIRRMAKLEAQLDSPAIPPRKTITTAPAVTTTLGSRPAVPGDAIGAAITQGDYAKYRDLANARDMAGVK